MAAERLNTIGSQPEDLFLFDEGPLAVCVNHAEKLRRDTNVITRLRDHTATAQRFGQLAIAESQELRFGISADKAYRIAPEDQQLRREAATRKGDLCPMPSSTMQWVGFGLF